VRAGVTAELTAMDPFRDPSLAEEARAEREEEERRARAAENAADEARAAEVRARWEAARREREGDPNSGLKFGIGLIALALVGFALTLKFGSPPKDERAVVVNGPAISVTVVPGEVRARDAASEDAVREAIRWQADRLAPCFDDGRASGALALQTGRSHAFTFGWKIKATGATYGVTVGHSGDPTPVEACIIGRIQGWHVDAVSEPAEVVGFGFERCTVAGTECLWPAR
jgi:hypothetical protein